MPELPEVETVRLQLRVIVGKKISQVKIFHPKTIAGGVGGKKMATKLTGKTIKNIERVGKLLIFSFTEAADLFLLAHLKMTGQFFYVQADGDISGGGHKATESDFSEFPGRHTRVAYYFTDGSVLYFNDMRLFGYNRLANKAALQKAQDSFGPEPIASDFDCEWFIKALRGSRRAVKARLLDQSFVAGLGNIYVDEALWRAKIRPTKRCYRINKERAKALALASGAVMQESIKAGGTTFQHFKDTAGQAGNFTTKLRVFGRAGLPCRRCTTPIKKIRLAGRGTHYCPSCQT